VKAHELAVGLLLLFAFATHQRKRNLPNCVAAQQTGGLDPRSWVTSRVARTVERLESQGFPPEQARELARSLVAQWAHETGRGRSEFNFNLGGWLAAPDVRCHVLPGFCGPGVERRDDCAWESWPNLDAAIDDHVARIAGRFQRAFTALLEAPFSDEWIRELGRGGYFTAPIDGYAAAWRKQREFVEQVVPNA
jgi:hypothetical protein